ncbi:MAG: molybdenum cofactor guanylyltransferase [Pseudomonadota bacterium]
MSKIIGVIFAGGQSRRFGSQCKAAAKLGDRPLLQRVLDGLSDQVSDVLISGLADWPEEFEQWPEFDRTALTLVPDLEPSRGPLHGVLSCLLHVRKHHPPKTDAWLMTTPCDTPLLPRNLTRSLYERAVLAKTQLVICADKNGLHPAHGLWHLSLLSTLERAIDHQGANSFHDFLANAEYAVARFDSADHFLNINTQEQLAELAKRI